MFAGLDRAQDSELKARVKQYYKFMWKRLKSLNKVCRGLAAAIPMENPYCSCRLSLPQL